MFDEEQHILRYWEREFGCLNPSKNRAGNRVYTDKDIKVLKVIKKLLRVDRLPVVAAKNLLKDGISDHLFDEADAALKNIVHELQAPETDDTDAPENSIAFVRLRREDVEQVIQLLHDVARQLESINVA